jgi:predicted AlkP superfamily phosphohydrolase/phosphomutase
MLLLHLAAIAALASASPISSPPQANATERLVIMSWDGATDWVVDRMLKEGKLPNVARMASGGVAAQYLIPAYPSKTAVGHVAMFTGAWGNINGVTNNSVPLLPRAEHTILQSRSGFDGNSMMAEPLWVRAAVEGKKVAALSAAGSFPPDPFIEQIKAKGGDPANFVQFSGFEHQIMAASTKTEFSAQAVDNADGWPGAPQSRRYRQTSIPAGDGRIHILIYDDPNDPVDGFDTMLIRSGMTTQTLKPRAAADDIDGWAGPFKVREGDLLGHAWFRLFSLSPDGKNLELYRGKVSGLRGTESPEEIERYLDAYGNFHDDSFFNYTGGMLGPTLWEGGNGEAERRLMEIVRLDCHFLKRQFDYAIQRWNPNLMFVYTPMSDSAGHVWMGALDPNRQGHDKALAAKLWPFYEQVHVLQDEWLGHVLDRLGPTGALTLVSDHGMEGISKTFYPNAALAAAGLMAYDGNRIVPERTKILTPPWSDFFLVVHGTDWKGGIVTPEQREEVLKAATEALLAVRDPETNQPVVTAVLRADELSHLGIGGPAGGDLYLDLAPGYYPSSRASQVAVGPSRSPIGDGVHGFLPFRRSMHGIFYAYGAGIAKGAVVPGLRQVDVAPTLAHLLGIGVPRDAVGHIIGGVFRR